MGTVAVVMEVLRVGGGGGGGGGEEQKGEEEGQVERRSRHGCSALLCCGRGKRLLRLKA